MLAWKVSESTEASALSLQSLSLQSQSGLIGCCFIMFQSSHAQKSPLSQQVQLVNTFRAHLAIPTLAEECVECNTSYAIPLLCCVAAINVNEAHY